MSLHPSCPIPLPPGDWFLLCVWRPTSDATAKAIRARWRASLAVMGVRTVEIEIAGLAALYREGVEELSDSARRYRCEKAHFSVAKRKTRHEP
jgi:hypothetical protein